MMPRIPLDELDDGIRDTVRWLRSLGFNTTDSGDGKKQSIACALDQPNVFMVLDGQDPAHWKAETVRLWEAVAARGIEVNQGMVQLSWDPVSEIAILCLFDVDDVLLACHGP